MTNWQMYWLLRLDRIVEILQVGAVTCFAVAIILACIYLIIKLIGEGLDDDEPKRVAAALVLPTKIAIVASVILACLFAFTPTTKQMAAIIVVPKIINNKDVQEIPQNLIELCNEWVKDKTEELKETD